MEILDAKPFSGKANKKDIAGAVEEPAEFRKGSQKVWGIWGASKKGQSWSRELSRLEQ